MSRSCCSAWPLCGPALGPPLPPPPLPLKRPRRCPHACSCSTQQPAHGLCMRSRSTSGYEELEAEGRGSAMGSKEDGAAEGRPVDQVRRRLCSGRLWMWHSTSCCSTAAARRQPPLQGFVPGLARASGRLPACCRRTTASAPPSWLPRPMGTRARCGTRCWRARCRCAQGSHVRCQRCLPR